MDGAGRGSLSQWERVRVRERCEHHCQRAAPSPQPSPARGRGSTTVRHTGNYRFWLSNLIRPVEMLTDNHPLKRVLHELYAHQLGNELALRRLSEREVSAY